MSEKRVNLDSSEKTEASKHMKRENKLENMPEEEQDLDGSSHRRVVKSLSCTRYVGIVCKLSLFSICSLRL